MCLEHLHFFQGGYDFTLHGFVLSAGLLLLQLCGPQNRRGENNRWVTEPYRGETKTKTIHLFFFLSALSDASECRQILFGICKEGLAQSKFQTTFYYFTFILTQRSTDLCFLSHNSHDPGYGVGSQTP